MKPHWYSSFFPLSSKSISQLAVFAVFVIAGLNLIGWALNITLLKSVSPLWNPMRVITAICFLLSAAALASLQGLASNQSKIVSYIFGVMISAVGLLTIASYLVELYTGQEWLLAHVPYLNLFLASGTRMADITAILFSGFGCVLILLGIGSRRTANISHAALLPMSMLSYLIIVGYIFNIRELYAWLNPGVALNTGIAFCMLCLASYCTRTDTWMMENFTGHESGSIVVRRLLPALIVLPLLIGWLRLYGEQSGLFVSEIGVALVAVTYTVCFLWLLWLNARSVNRIERQAEMKNKRLLHSIQEEKDRLQSLVNSINDEIWFADTKKIFTLANPSALNEFGLNSDSDTIDIQKFAESLEVYRPDGSPRPAEEAPPLRALVGEIVRNQEEIIRTSARSELRYRQVSSNPVRNAGGQIIGSVSVVRDITERKQAEEEMKNLIKDLDEHRGRLEAIINSLPVGLWITDATGKIIFTNDMADNIWGSKAPLADRIKGYEEYKAWWADTGDYIVAEDMPLARAIKGDICKDKVIDFERFDGTRGTQLVSAVPIKTSDDKIIGSIAIVQDITERKQAETELRERTKELEVTNKELESFSYTISHDLRAPLRAIDGFARMILKKQGNKFDEDTLDKFNVIRSNAQMMGQLIDDLLAFSRLGRKELAISELDMEGLIQDVWKELQVINPDRHIGVKIHKIPAGMGDRKLIKQVYANLLSNAIKFTKNRENALIEAGGHEDGNENIYYVKDNGVGFDMEYYDKLFGVFQRLHSGDEYDGTGVGLAIVQRIVHRHGGRVWAEGKEDQGACFYFTLRKS